MIIRIRLGHWRFTFTLYEVTDITGVNSLLPDGNHILMWDFDDIPLWQIKLTLALIQQDYILPQIRILNTGKKNHYIAYCFKRCSWWDTKRIIAATPFVCSDYYKWGIFRKRFTLRVTPKENRKPKLAATLYSNIPEDVNISELTSWVKDTLKVHALESFFPMHNSEDSSSAMSFLPRQENVSANNTRRSLTKHQCGG
jgi:hypothetical protein